VIPSFDDARTVRSHGYVKLSATTGEPDVLVYTTLSPPVYAPVTSYFTLRAFDAGGLVGESLPPYADTSKDSVSAAVP